MDVKDVGSKLENTATAAFIARWNGGMGVYFVLRQPGSALCIWQQCWPLELPRPPIHFPHVHPYVWESSQHYMTFPSPNKETHLTPRPSWSAVGQSCAAEQLPRGRWLSDEAASLTHTHTHLTI